MIISNFSFQLIYVCAWFRWSTIARSLPGRTDNEIKNYWRTHFKKKITKVKDVKSRLLKRQRFQQQLQLQQFHMQQNKVGMEKITSVLEERENKEAYFPTMVVRQQENIFDEHEISLLLNGGCCYDSSYVPETPMNEDVGIWDGLWNLDDPNFCVAKAS